MIFQFKIWRGFRPARRQLTGRNIRREEGDPFTQLRDRYFQYRLRRFITTQSEKVSFIIRKRLERHFRALYLTIEIE